MEDEVVDGRCGCEPVGEKEEKGGEDKEKEGEQEEDERREREA